MTDANIALDSVLRALHDCQVELVTYKASTKYWHERAIELQRNLEGAGAGNGDE